MACIETNTPWCQKLPLRPEQSQAMSKFFWRVKWNRNCSEKQTSRPMWYYWFLFTAWMLIMFIPSTLRDFMFKFISLCQCNFHVCHSPTLGCFIQSTAPRESKPRPKEAEEQALKQQGLQQRQAMGEQSCCSAHLTCWVSSLFQLPTRTPSHNKILKRSNMAWLPSNIVMHFSAQIS